MGICGYNFLKQFFYIIFADSSSEFNSFPFVFSRNLNNSTISYQSRAVFHFQRTKKIEQKTNN